MAEASVDHIAAISIITEIDLPLEGCARTDSLLAFK